MSDLAIRVENLSKKYKIGVLKNRHDTLRDHLVHSVKSLFSRNGHPSFQPSTLNRQPSDILWALNDVSFEVKKGEVIGIVGGNGAGKSTLLKILSRITEPTKGRAEVYGRIGSLLEVGTGFHPELTGRENIYLNGAILGMKKTEINRRFDEIVAFAEIEKFIDTPVKRYSSGMYVRLGFAVAAHMETEILMVDEVLSVGDVTFQKKCLGKMDEVAHVGKTVLFVSHAMAAIQQLCPSAILIASGRLVEQGPTEQVVSKYLNNASCSEDGDFDFSNHAARLVKQSPVIKRLTLLSKDGIPTSRFYPGDAFIAELTIEPRSPIRDPRVALAIEDSFGRRITTVASYFQDSKVGDIRTPCRIRCTLPQLHLGSGRYLLSVSIGDGYGGMLDGLENAAWFEVGWQNNYGTGEAYHSIYGPVLTPSTWEKVE